ncbi:uncharacterized protein LOC110699836 [Chenopodium quinoa]|uniref:uncharacterized protein LOC110699836 n=1 Tax=Chenopodium quinoa TaxID=63459 RepID=UPI000B789149|nr:uncharacterized protein LOC110699836 [Chenopodium quinoa]
MRKLMIFSNNEIGRCMNAYDPEARLQRIKAYVGFLNEAEPEKLLHIFSAKPELEIEDPLPIEYKNMAERTLKELGASRIGEDPFCIVFPKLENPLKLNSGFLNLLPKFYGNASENPYRHLKEFKVVCSSMNPEGVEQEHIRLHAFPFSLQDPDKECLYEQLSPSSINSWAKMEKVFLERFFTASRIGSIRKEICGIRQNYNKSLYEYWQRFNRLCSSCPQHQISEQLLIQ